MKAFTSKQLEIQDKIELMKSTLQSAMEQELINLPKFRDLEMQAAFLEERMGDFDRNSHEVKSNMEDEYYTPCLAPIFRLYHAFTGLPLLGQVAIVTSVALTVGAIYYRHEIANYLYDYMYANNEAEQISSSDFGHAGQYNETSPLIEQV